ncbi:hypothetical protein [Pseudanabaena sp. PCC 6802]|uniref:hypothetical protein n=1 Tax=Pseudanabaena sp. PCC 6802 TaxID=118173 RepID=UPI0003463474|nr:hypothetical protein [Pseudanabaena sp. PCC 6802]
MPKYKVNSPLYHDGKRYEPGGIVEMVADLAEGLPRDVLGDQIPEKAPAKPAEKPSSEDKPVAK